MEAVSLGLFVLKELCVGVENALLLCRIRGSARYRDFSAAISDVTAVTRFTMASSSL